MSYDPFDNSSVSGKTLGFILDIKEKLSKNAWSHECTRVKYLNGFADLVSVCFSRAYKIMGQMFVTKSFK